MFLAGCTDRKGFGAIFGSDDGRKWDPLFREEKKERGATFYDFAVADGTIVAVGGGDGPWKSGPFRVVASQDAATWSGPSFTPELPGPLLCVAAGKGRFVAHGGSGYIARYTFSTDGRDWADPGEHRIPAVGGEHHMLTKLAFGNDRFVGIGGYRRVMSSADGAAWQDHPDPQRPPLISLAFGAGVFVAGGMHGLRVRSKDGLRWESKAEGEIGEHINEIAWTGTEFVAVGIEVTFKSPDGARWTKHPSSVRPARARYGGGVFLCSNLRGTEVHRSADAVAWERVEPIKDHLFSGGFGYWEQS